MRVERYLNCSQKGNDIAMGTIVTAAVLVCIVGLAVRKMVKDKKSGKSLQCGCDCAHCGGCGAVKGK